VSTFQGSSAGSGAVYESDIEYDGVDTGGGGLYGRLGAAEAALGSGRPRSTATASTRPATTLHPIDR
jgi:hypothetical protein